MAASAGTGNLSPPELSTAGKHFDCASADVSRQQPRKKYATYLSIAIVLGLIVGMIGCFFLDPQNAAVGSEALGHGLDKAMVNLNAKDMSDMKQLLEQPEIRAELEAMMDNPAYFEQQAKRFAELSKANGGWAGSSNLLSESAHMLGDPVILAKLKKMISVPEFKQMLKRTAQHEKASGELVDPKALAKFGFAFNPTSLRGNPVKTPAWRSDSIRMQGAPPPPKKGERLGATVDQDGKSNVWAVEPVMKTEKTDKGLLAYAPVIGAGVLAVALIPILPLLFSANPDQV